MANILDSYTANGSFDTEKYFTFLYDVIPCMYTFAFEKEEEQLDPKKIKFDRVKHLFKVVKDVREINSKCIKDPDQSEIEYSSGTPIIEEIFDVDDNGTALTFAADNKVIRVCYNKIVILYDYNKDSLESVEKLTTNIYNIFDKYIPESKAARVGLIKYSNGEYYTTFSSIKKTLINIDENYNDDFHPVYKDIIDFLNQRESGLILLHGEMGSGNFL